MYYAGQKALVVGASGGIGRAIAEELLEQGADVAITYRSGRGAAEELAASATERGRRCHALPVDLRSPESIVKMAETVAEHLGTPDIVVTSAGVLRDRPLVKMATEDWETVLNVNLTGNFHLLRQLIPRMMKNRGGRIVNVASVSGLYGQPGQANYAASKGGLIAMTRALARELGPFNITVNAIAPGYVETDMTQVLSEGFRRRLLERIPLRRFATPADVVPVARLLMAPDGAYITGQVFIVDGGLSA